VYLLRAYVEAFARNEFVRTRQRNDEGQGYESAINGVLSATACMVTAGYLFTIGAPPDDLEIGPFSLVLYGAAFLVGGTICGLYAILNFSAALGNKRQKQLLVVQQDQLVDGPFKYTIAPPSCFTTLFENEKPEWGRVLQSILCAIVLLLLGCAMLPLSLSMHQGMSSGHTRNINNNQAGSHGQFITMADVHALVGTDDLVLPTNQYGKVTVVWGVLGREEVQVEDGGKEERGVFDPAFDLADEHTQSQILASCALFRESRLLRMSIDQPCVLEQFRDWVSRLQV
jgi:hypothetical protein